MKNDIWVHSANGRKAYGYFNADTEKLCFEGEEITVEELERAMKIIRNSKNKAVEKAKNNDYHKGYEACQTAIMRTLANIFMMCGEYPCSSSQMVIKLINSVYGDVLEFKLYKGDKPIKCVDIAYPDSLNHPSILIYSLGRIYSELKGGEKSEI